MPDLLANTSIIQPINAAPTASAATHMRVNRTSAVLGYCLPMLAAELGAPAGRGMWITSPWAILSFNFRPTQFEQRLHDDPNHRFVQVDHIFCDICLYVIDKDSVRRVREHR